MGEISKRFSSVTNFIKSFDYRTLLGRGRSNVEEANAEVSMLQEADLAGCVGKLPVYVDFIRSNLGVDEAKALDKWIQEGFMYLSRRRMEAFKQVFNKFPDLRFTLYGSEQNKTVVGVMVAGQDQSGREYPFVIFRVLGRRYSSADISSLPLYLEEFYSSAMDLCKEDRSNQDKLLLLQQVERLVSQHPVEDSEPSSSTNRWLDLYSADTLWSSILPNDTKGTLAAYIAEFNYRLREVLSQTPSNTPWGLEIAIYNEQKQNLVQVFFLTLIDKILGGTAWQGHTWLAKNQQNRVRLIIFFRPPQIEDLMTLIDYESGLSHLVRLEECNESTESDISAAHCMLHSSKDTLALLQEKWLDLFRTASESRRDSETINTQDSKEDESGYEH